MKNESKAKDNNFYLYSVVLLIFVLPLISVLVDFWINSQQAIWWMTTGKWFLFWAIGLRLIIAGIRQVINPAFTAEEIFHLESKETYVIVKELGFANVCLGTIAALSLFVPEWRTAAALSGGMFFGIAGAYHIFKKPAGKNEVIALISDVIIFSATFVYLVLYLLNR